MMGIDKKSMPIITLIKLKIQSFKIKLYSKKKAFYKEFLSQKFLKGVAHLIFINLYHISSNLYWRSYSGSHRDTDQINKINQL